MAKNKRVGHCMAPYNNYQLMKARKVILKANLHETTHFMTNKLNAKERRIVLEMSTNTLQSRG